MQEQRKHKARRARLGTARLAVMLWESTSGWDPGRHLEGEDRILRDMYRRERPPDWLQVQEEEGGRMVTRL